MTRSLDSTTGRHLIEGVETLLRDRALQVDQNEIWLGLEPDECRTLLEHFAASATKQRLPDLYFVSSADPNALGLRNRVAGPKPTLLVILDERWEPRSQDFGQSLFDLSRKQAAELLRERVDFPVEMEWLSLAKRDDQREWIRALFDVLRGKDQKYAVRDREGQTMRLRLSEYFKYLAHTLSEAGDAPDEALARAIYRLGLFTHPALALELRPKRSVASAQQLRERMATSLSQNFRAARDSDEFAAQLASSQRTAEKVLDDYLKKGGRLSSNPALEEAAREAFRAFLRQQAVEDALRRVDWEFHEATAAGEAKVRRGRKRRFGVRGVLADRDSLAEKRQRIVEIFVQRAPDEQEEQTRQDVERLTDELGRGATADAALQELRSRALSLWKDPGPDKLLEQLLGSLEAIHRRAKRRDALEIDAENLIAGLIEFGVWVRKISDSTPPKEWTITYPQKTTHAIQPMSEGWRSNTHKLLRAAAHACVEEESPELEDGEEPPDTISVPLEVAAGNLTRQIVLQTPRDWTQAPFRLSLGQPRQLIIDEAPEPIRLQATRSPMDLPEPLREIAESISGLARDLDPCGPYAFEQVRRVVMRYEELLNKATAGGSAEQAARLAALEARLKQLRKGAPERLQILEEIQELREHVVATTSESLSDPAIRALARFQTLLPESVERPAATAAGPNRAWLMPLHPMCLRARVVADDVGLKVLSALMNPQRQFTELQLAFLSDALDEIKVPEPCRFLTPWNRGETWPPLVFQGYDQHFAEFAPSQATRGSYGRHVLLQVLRDYVELYPTAKDRLLLYLEADEDGRLAYQLSTGLTFGSEDSQSMIEGIDLRLVVGENGHLSFLAERAATRAGLDERLFSIVRGRLKPRVLFRAAPVASASAPEGACHAAVVYAGRKRPGTGPLLAGEQLARPQVEVPLADPLSLASIVAPCVPQISGSGTMLRAFSARDHLDRGWEQLQARVYWQQVGSQFATELNLAPEQNGAALRALHETADWVIILSELPIHQALEAFDRKVVRLIDRKQFLEDGRACNLTVSTSHSEVIEDLLAQEMERVCGKRPQALDGLLAFVQRFAPGLAMRCVGRPADMGPGGILGLLLTARAGELGAPGSIAVPLDEHPWVYGRGGIRADVLLVQPTGDGLQLQILESKYSKDGADEVAKKGAQQVERSATALRGWMDLEEIDAYFRRRLYDMIIAHCAGSPEREGLARRLVEGAHLEMSKISEVHIWIWSGNVTAEVSEEGDVRTVVHPATETREKLSELAAAPQP